MRRISMMLFIVSCVISLVFVNPSYAKSKKEAIVEEQDLPPLKGPKKTIAVTNFQNKAGYHAEWDLGTGLADMLTTSLVKSDRFTVVERQTIADILQEQDFGGTGRTRETGANKTGKILNAQVLIRGSVTEFEEQSSGNRGEFSYAGISLGSASAKSHIALNISLYDVTSGEVIDSVRVEGNASKSTMGLNAAVMGAGIDTASYLKTPTGQAAQQAIDQAVAFIIQKMEKVAWQGNIVTIKEDEIYINAGKNLSINIGNIFIVYKKGEELIDPESGTTLGSEIKNIGEIQVQSVDEKFSKATATAGDIKSFSKGDIIKMK